MREELSVIQMVKARKDERETNVGSVVTVGSGVGSSVTGSLAVGSTTGSLSVDETVFSPVEVVSLQATGRRCQLRS